MLFSGVFDFTDRASRWDAILLRPTNPEGLTIGKTNNINLLHPVGMCET